MPVWSKDIQYGAAAGFIIIVGIVAIQFGFSAKLVLALLAGVGVLFCASLFDGLPRAAMLGAGAVLLLLVAYDLATSCDSACQQSRAEAARQTAEQQQARLAALQGHPAATVLCPGIPPTKPRTLHADWEPLNVANPEAKCDAVYAVVEGEVEFGGPDGGYTVAADDKTIGRKDVKVLTRARAKGDHEVKLYYMACPLGTGPTNGTWECRRVSN